MSRLIMIVLCVLSGALFGCVEATDVPEPLHGVQMGQDPLGVYNPIANGEEIPVIYGYQGGFHLPMAIQAAGAEHGEVLEMWFTVTDISTDEVVAQNRFLRQVDDIDENGNFIVGGLYVLVEGPDLVADRKLRITAEISDGDAVSSVERWVWCVNEH
ncbi:MAG: hypothetical protein ACE366_30205 [Bradymonadia bacterium]